jgi:signal transduction histidine kinase
MRKSSLTHPLGNVRLRIVAVTALLLAGASAVSLVLLSTALTQRLDEEITTALVREIEEFELLAGGVNPSTGDPFGDDLEAVFDLYFAREVPDEGETLVAFVSGELYMAESDSAALPTEALAEPIAIWLDERERQSGWMMVDAGEIHYQVVPVAADERAGTFVAVNFPFKEQQEINQAVGTLGLIEGITILVATVIAYLLSGQVLRPLRSLADTARRISETDLTQRMPIRGNDEASGISKAFNDMLARLESAFGTQRRFLDEASHELRAPLTVIRGHLELLELEDDPDERAATTALITGEIDRMNRMVEDLLTLARAERPDFLDAEPVDLAAWTAECFSKARMLGARDWRLDRAASGVVEADAQRLTQAVMQLAANACQHSVEGSIVRIGSERSGGTLRIWVQDEGEGVPPEDAERIFERFQRGRHERRSTGLGLSIVMAIAEAHGGRAVLVESAAPGARFEITIPVAVSGPERQPSARTGDLTPA